MSERLDWFLSTTLAPEAEITDEIFQTLVEHAESYLRATGTISWSEWQCLTTKSRAAFEEAGKRIEEVRCAKMADLIAVRLLGDLQAAAAGEGRRP